MMRMLAPVSLMSLRCAIPTIMKITSATALPMDAIAERSKSRVRIDTKMGVDASGHVGDGGGAVRDGSGARSGGTHRGRRPGGRQRRRVTGSASGAMDDLAVARSCLERDHA